MKHALVRIVIALGVITLGAMACRPGDPLEPKTPPNSPLPTKLDRPDDSPPPSSPSLPKLTPDSGAH